MIKDFEPVLGEGFPSAVEVKSASGTFPDMGARTITLQCRFDGQTTPDFTKVWEFVYKGNKYIMPLRKPQGSKENTSLSGELELPFQHWAEYQLQRYFFFELYSVQAGTVIPDKYIASVELNLENFGVLFSRVLEYWYGDKITLDIDQATIQNATSDVQKVEISYSKVWEVLLKFHEVFGVRWQIEPNGDSDHYVIKVRYGSENELSHIFEYGFKGGLMKVERQVQNPDISNIILGRGGEKNLPYRYFKDVDTNNPTFKADPDWIPELALMPFTQLHGATFRSYVRGWKAKHYGGTTTADGCYAPWAWQKGYTDEKFSPVEFVYDAESIAFYGELWDALDDNDEIYPSIQGRVRADIGRIDEVVAVEPIISDDYEAKSEKESQPVNVALCRQDSVFVKKESTETVTLVGGSFTIPEGLTGIFEHNAATAEAYDNPRFNGASSASARGNNGRVAEYDKFLTATVTKVNIQGATSASGIPAGTYTWSVEIEVKNNSKKDLTATVALPNPTIIASNIDEQFTNTWCVWIKDVFNTPKPANKSAEAFASDVWDPLLGDHLGSEAALFFTSGMLSTSEDYTFLLTKRPEYDTSKSIEVDGIGTVQSMWKLTLAKSDADLEATNLWLPSTMRQASAGDHFAFEGIELPHQYVLLAEEELDNVKKQQLEKIKDIKPTWVVKLDKVRISRAQFDDVTALIDQLTPGAAVRLHDPRFILNAQGTPAAYETLYITNVNINWNEPSSDSPALIPDVEITLSDEYEVAASTISLMQSEIDALTRQVGSIGNIEQLVRAVGDKLYLRKDGLADISMSPTQFFSLLTSGDFRNGMVGGAGWGFFRDANGNWVLETDRINVRQEMLVNSLVINQVKGQGGTIVESAAVIEAVTEVIEDATGYYCYFDTKNGTVFNQFRLDDVAYCHRYVPTTAADNAGDDVTFGTVKLYKRRVIEVGDNYIKLSKTEVNGSGIPAEGDAIIHYGNYTNKQRQYVKVRDVIGGGYERYLEDLNSVNATGTEYYFVGRQAGMYNNRPRFYLGDKNGYIEWVDGELNIKGKLNTLSTIGDTTIGDYVNNAAKAAADAAKAELQGKINDLQNQVDGVVEAWSYPYTPTTSNYPADQWTTEGEKNAHVGDVFYNIQPAYNADGTANPDAGKAWRWSQGDDEHGGAYHWHPIADSDAVRALQLAQMSVLDTDVLFRQHTSPTDAPAVPTVNTEGTITNLNGWSTNAPAYEAGKYIWQTTYVKKGDGQASFSDPTCISGRDGAAAKIVTVNADNTAFVYKDDFKTLVGPQRIYLSATLQGTTGYQWSYKLEGQTAWTAWPDANGTTANVSIIPDGIFGTTARSMTIRCTSGGVYDEITIVKVSSGSNGTNGANGQDAYTILLSNESHIFEGDTEKATSASTTSEVIAYKGATRVAATICTITGAPTGMTVTIANNGTTSAKFTVSVNTALTTKQGTLNIPVTVDGKTFTQVFSWSLSLEGNGIDHIDEEYYLSTSRTALQGGSWSKTRQPWVAGHFYWTRSHVYYTDGTDETYGEVCVTGESGANAPNLVIKYSSTGGTAESEWHPTYAAGDIWMKTSNDGGYTWSPAMPFVGASYTDNLYLNTAYKDGTDKWTFWRSASATINDDALVVTTNNQNQQIVAQQKIEVKAGEKFTLSGWVKADRELSLDYTYLLYSAGTNQKIGASAFITDSTATTDWKFFVVQFTASRNGLASAGFGYLLSASSNVTLYLKGLKWERGFNPDPQWTPAASEMIGQDGKWRKFQWALGTETAVTGTWQDTPMNAPTGQYVWMRSGIVVPPATNPTTWETATRLTGDKGGDGYMLDLSDEMMPMPCDAAGNVTGAYSTSQASVYKGTTKLTSGVKYSIAQQTGVSATITTAGLVTPSALTADKGTIVVQAVVDGVTLQTTLSLYKVKPGSSYSNNLVVGSKLFKTPLFASGILGTINTSDELVVTCQSGNGNWLTGFWQSLNATEIENSFAEGDDFTISFTIKSSQANAKTPTIYLKSGMGYFAMKGTVSSRYSVVYYSGKWKKANNLSIHLGWGDCAGQYEIQSWKIEKGANPNPVWSPAQSEMEGEDGQDAVVYQLELSANNISRNVLGQLSTSEITIQKYKTTGASARVLTTDKIIRYQRLGVDSGYTQVNAGTNQTKVSNLNNPAMTALLVELYDTDGTTILDRERVPLIQDGAELTDNLVLNSEINKTTTDYLIAQFSVSEELVVGDTYTFTIWGTIASGKQLGIWDSRGIQLNAFLTKIADGVYSASFKWAMSANASKTLFSVYNYPNGTAGSATINRIKVEKGQNLAPVWTQSPHDMDYLKKAMQENGSMEGGLILASLMQMGFTNSAGVYKKMSGVSGIANESDALAFWAGGEMIDPEKQPNASNLPAFGIRHDGTGFAAGNTIRFLQNLIQVGDCIDLDKEGLKMNVNGSTKLIVGDASINANAVNSFNVEKDLSDVPNQKIYNTWTYTNNGNQVYMSNTSAVKTSGNLGAVAVGRTITLSGTVYFHAPGFNTLLPVNPLFVPKLVVKLLDNTTVLQTSEITSGRTLVNGTEMAYDLSKVQYTTKKAISNLKVSFQFVNNKLTEPYQGSTQDSFGCEVAGQFITLRIYTKESILQDVAVLGADGTQFSWGDSHQCQTKDFWGVRVGQVGIKMDKTRIYVMVDGQNWWTLLNLFQHLQAGDIEWP